MHTFDKKALFWDVDPTTLDEEEHAPFIIDRVLAFGDLDDIAWARATYGDEMLKERTVRSRSLDAKSRAFWCTFYQLDRATCIPKSSSQAPSPFSLR